MRTTTRAVPALLRFLLLGALILLAQPVSLAAATLQAILIGDTMDKNIGKDLLVDLKNMQKEMERVARYADMTFRLTVIKGSAVEPSTVWETIDELKVGPDDTIVFYWTGHGYRTDSKKDNPWPYLYFSQQSLGMDYSEVIDTLNAKGARLLVTLADCCNNRISDWNAPPTVELSVKDNDQMAYHYARLFLEARGSVLVTSSRAGEYSYSTPNGGMFSVAYLRVLADTVNSPSDVAWEQIMEKISKETESSQHPTYIVDLQ